MEIRIRQSKVKHSITLLEHEEALLQQFYEKFACKRKMNIFLSLLVSIGLDRSLNFDDDWKFNYGFQIARERNLKRAEGKSPTIIKNTQADGQAQGAKIIQFPGVSA
jgi:hypothetical protein